ncbi:hypothetical protein L1F30_11825 [Simiduia sp. 21SJ11W-1]|uniref:hypothetical protein n=1 Tax=Simiduia sp. 21SJ11W-1 TaxID=2909669 RepID=UPI00209F0F7D|nr:hypothetical protein [Simiduia sp. 21SJ11W-1]UTA46849.1 hypothetical protein L1F30_11825 [Simiduia sp. 21SJ11W-1]
MGGGAAFEIILTAILAALTGGVGAVASMASKARHMTKFKKLGELLVDFAKASKQLAAHTKARAKQAAKAAKKSFDDLKTDMDAPVQKGERPKATREKVNDKSILSLADSDRKKVSELSEQAHEAELRNDIEKRDRLIEEAREILADYLDDDSPAELLARLDVDSPKDGAFFWSGYQQGALDKAAEFAREANGVSLETTKGGRIVNNWDQLNNSPISGQFWGDFSEKYASGVGGKVRVVHSDEAFLDGGSKIWRTRELPTIAGEGKVESIEILDLNGRQRVVYNKEQISEMAINISGAGD